jgi:hypothetical protein
MCAAPNSTTQTVTTKDSTSASTSSTAKQGSKPIPKWLKLKQQNRSSAGKTAKPTTNNSSEAGKLSSAQKPSQQTRNEKRARWAKKNRPVAKPAVKLGPVKEYLCECHGEPARKPKAGTKVAMQDPESKKMKDKSLGLGKWRCATTGKVTKVSPQTPKAKVADAIPGSKSQPTIGGSFPDIIYPAKLQTPVLTEALNATAAV